MSPWITALLFAFAPVALHSQTAEPPQVAAPAPTVAQPPERRTALALGEAMLVNLAVNRFDYWVLREDWAGVAPRDWKRNLNFGWEWDENDFVTNMFAHPYHGAMYFNSGRSNGLGYWESIPITFLGSFTWEYFGEANRPSLNDFFMTTFGGITLGEVFHRVGASLRDNSKSGGNRRLREIAALPFDLIGGINRFARGEWTKIGPNPAEHDPGSFVFRLGTGGRVTLDTGVVDTVTKSATLVADLEYGDLFERDFESPFDAFSIRAQISPGSGGLNLLRASGRVFGFNLNRHDSWHRHTFNVNQRFDYVNNPAYKFGSQSVEAGLASRWSLGKGFHIRTDVFFDAMLLGALDAPYGGVGERSYDFGPGGGVRVDLAFGRRGVSYLKLTTRSEFLHSVSGAEADHFVGMGGLEATVPLARGLGVGAHAVYYNRLSRYFDDSQALREFPEIRLMLIWTSASGSSPREQP